MPRWTGETITLEVWPGPAPATVVVAAPVAAVQKSDLLWYFNAVSFDATAQCGYLICKEINQHFIGIETDNTLRIRHEIGKRVHVVEQGHPSRSSTAGEYAQHQAAK